MPDTPHNFRNAYAVPRRLTRSRTSSRFPAGMFGIGIGELLLILVVALLLYGGDLPRMAYRAGKLMREFRAAFRRVEEELRREVIEPLEQEELRHERQRVNEKRASEANPPKDPPQDRKDSPPETA